LRAHLQTKIYTRAQDIREYVRQKWCIIYSVSGMTDWPRRNNYSFHKPLPAPAKADIQAQLTFIETYETLKKALPATEKIVFMAELILKMLAPNSPNTHGLWLD
jgi:Winged helix-turn helix